MFSEPDVERVGLTVITRHKQVPGLRQVAKQLGNEFEVEVELKKVRHGLLNQRHWLTIQGSPSNVNRAMMGIGTFTF